MSIDCTGNERGRDVIERTFEAFLKSIGFEMTSVTQRFNENMRKTLSKNGKEEWQSILPKMVQDVGNQLKTTLLRKCLEFFDCEVEDFRSGQILLSVGLSVPLERTLLMSEHLRSYIADITHPLSQSSKTECNEIFFPYLHQRLSLEGLEGGYRLQERASVPKEEEDSLLFSLQEKLHQVNEEYLGEAAQLIDGHLIPQSMKDKTMSSFRQLFERSVENIAKEWQRFSLLTPLSFQGLWKNGKAVIKTFETGLK